MPRRAYVVLADGSSYQGYSFGAETETYGETVFNTGMTGYQEALTDPSYAGQLVVFTYPLVGNYGINFTDNESIKVQVAGFIVREHCTTPDKRSDETTLHEFLTAQGVPGVYGIDTRSITRRLRRAGVMMGTVCLDSPRSGKARLARIPKYDTLDYVKRVTTKHAYQWKNDWTAENGERNRILVNDYGVKNNILNMLSIRDCDVIVVPATVTSKEILGYNPDGILLSPGPGDPALLDYIVDTLDGILGKIPIMGICLGHQVVARALGAKTFKLKFGHRGANHPVKEIATGRINITAQNHGYAVDDKGLPKGLTISHTHVNDGTIEGMIHQEMKIMTIQYHSEASPGPRDNEYIFDRFLDLIADKKGLNGPL